MQTTPPPAIVSECVRALNDTVREPDDTFAGHYHTLRPRAEGEPIDKSPRWLRIAVGESPITVECGYDEHGKLYHHAIPPTLVHGR